MSRFLPIPWHADLWFGSYCRGRALRVLRDLPVKRVWLTIADHYEPYWNTVDDGVALRRVREWADRWPEIASQAPADSAGRQPVYSFFYPEEEYRARLVYELAEMHRGSIADVEVHIHHDREQRAQFINRMNGFTRKLHEEHGLLRQHRGRISFGFIHGNWVLDNSGSDGRWCGLNDEITILRDLGCYADFTMPAGSHSAQAAMVNQVYWCIDDPARPKSYNRGTPICRGDNSIGDLMMIPGPIGLRWRERLVPRLETGELAHNNRPSRYRVRRWFDLAPQLGNDVFIKLFTHGTQERNSAVLLGGDLLQTYRLVDEEARRRGAEVYWASAWQMYRAIDALREGINPTQREEVAQREGFAQRAIS